MSKLMAGQVAAHYMPPYHDDLLSISKTSIMSVAHLDKRAEGENYGKTKL